MPEAAPTREEPPGPRGDCGLRLQTCGPSPETVISVVSKLRVLGRVGLAPGSCPPRRSAPGDRGPSEGQGSIRGTGVRRSVAGVAVLFFPPFSFLSQVHLALQCDFKFSLIQTRIGVLSSRTMFRVSSLHTNHRKLVDQYGFF